MFGWSKRTDEANGKADRALDAIKRQETALEKHGEKLDDLSTRFSAFDAKAGEWRGTVDQTLKNQDKTLASIGGFLRWLVLTTLPALAGALAFIVWYEITKPH
jgi:hypothetical protein